MLPWSATTVKYNQELDVSSNAHHQSSSPLLHAVGLDACADGSYIIDAVTKGHHL